MSSLAQCGPVDPAQVQFDKKAMASASAATASAGSGLAGMGLFMALKRCWLVWLAVFLITGNFIALYVLHFEDRPGGGFRGHEIHDLAFTASTGFSPSEGDVVSFSGDNVLRNGAGTTAYLDTFTLTDTDAQYYQYINLAPLTAAAFPPTTSSAVSSSGTRDLLVSYRRVTAADGSSFESVVTTATFSPATKALTVHDDYDASANVVASASIRGLATLSSSLAIALSVEDGSFPYITSVMPATLASGSGSAHATVTLVPDKLTLVTDTSATNVLAALSESVFVVAFYDTYAPAPTGYGQLVKVGTVSTDGTQTITFSSDTPSFAPNNIYGSITTNFGTPRLVPSVATATGSTTQLTFVIPYYATVSDDAFSAQDRGLCVTMATYDSSDRSVSAFDDGSCNAQFQPTNLVDSVMVTETVLALAFYDGNNNHALTVALVQFTFSHVAATSTEAAKVTTTALFRGSFVVPGASGAFVHGTQYSYTPKPSLARMTRHRLAVSFENPSQSGAPSVVILQLSPASMTLQDVTPVLPLAERNFTLDISSGGLNKAITHDLIAVGDDSVAVAYLGKRGLTTHQRFSVVEAFGTPVGILNEYDAADTSSVEVSVAGGMTSTVTCKANGGLMKAGLVYYATTAGYVVAAADTTSVEGEYFSVEDGEDKLLVTTDSKVGIAIDDNTLFVTTGS